MKKQFAAALLITVSPILFVSCVSSILQEKAPTFSNEVNYVAPAQPFNQLKKSVYPSWKNKETGNVLAILSDCQTGNSASLNDLQRLIEDSIDNPKRVNESTTQFQNKPALTRTTQGELDGLPLEIKSIAFKRLNCGYIVSLSGKPEQLKLDQNAFDQFLKSLTFK